MSWKVRLAGTTTTDPNDEYVKANDFVSEIEHYQLPVNLLPTK